MVISPKEDNRFFNALICCLISDFGTELFSKILSNPRELRRFILCKTVLNFLVYSDIFWYIL